MLALMMGQRRGDGGAGTLGQRRGGHNDWTMVATSALHCLFVRTVYRISLSSRMQGVSMGRRTRRITMTSELLTDCPASRAAPRAGAARRIGRVVSAAFGS